MSSFQEFREELERERNQGSGAPSRSDGTGSRNNTASRSGNTSGGSSGSGSSFQKFREELEWERGSVDEAYIDRFVQDADRYMSGAQAAYQGMNWSNAAYVYGENRKTIEDLRNRRAVIEQYLERNRSSFDWDSYSSFKSYLSELDKATGGLADSFRERSGYFSQFETQKDYDDHVAYWTDYNEKKNFDLEAGQQEIRELENLLKEYELLVKWGVDGKGRERAQEIRSQYGGWKGIKDLISQKTAYLNQAKRVQNGITLAGAANNADFKDYSGYVTTKADGVWSRLTSDYGLGYEDLTYEYINNQDGLRDEIKQKHRVYDKNDDESVYESNGYDYLTDNEIAIYNYYYAKEGREKAEEYLDSIQATLQNRKATSMYGNMEGKTALELVFSARAGLDQFESGMKNLFNTKDNYIAPSAFQMASAMVREDLADAGPMLPDFMGGASLGQMAYDAINTTANMAPSILGSVAANIIAPGSGVYVSGALLGASAAGNAYQEALNEGYSKDQAKGYGLLVGASEIVMEKLLGGISEFGGNALGKFFTRNLSNADTALKMVAKRLGGSMISEFSEEYLQEVLNPVFQNMMLGTDNEVKIISPEAIYSGMLGALTAGIMEGPGIVGGEVGTHNTGRRLQDAGISAERLAQIGNTFAADTVAYKLSGIVDESTGAYTMGRLFKEIGASMSEQNISDITNALVKKGMDEKTAEANARVMAAVVEGANFTDTDVAIIEANDILSEAVRTTIIDQNATWYQRTNGYNEALMALAQEKAALKTSGKSRAAGAESGAGYNGVEGFNLEEYLSASDDQELDQEYDKLESLYQQKAALDKKSLEAFNSDHYEEFERLSAESASIDEQITSVEGRMRELRAAKAEGAAPETEADAGGKVGTEGHSEADAGGSGAMRISAINNGVATVKLADGSEVSVREADLDPDEGVRIENIASIEGISAEDANFILNTLKVSPGASAQMDALGAKEAYRYGFYGFSPDHIAKHGVFANALSESQRTAIYQTGQKARQAQVAAEQAAVSKKETTTRKVSGKVHFNGDRSVLTERQSASLSALETVADALGVQIYVFESELNDRGKRVGANGWYDPKDNSIHIDLHAGASGEGTMLFTAAHELTHHIRKWSPAKFKTLADFLMQEYGKKGVNVDGLVREQMEKARRDGRSISYDTAYEEVVADSMETMLSDGKVMEKLAKLKQQDKSLWEKIRDYISELAGKIRSVYEGLSPDSAEGRYVAEMKDSIEKLQELFTEALAEAGENYQAAQEGVDAGAEMSNEEAFFDSKTAVLYQIRPPYSDGSKAFNTFADGLNPEARKTFELFYGFYQKSRIESALSVSGKKVRKVNISSLYLLAQDWNAMLEKEPKWAQAAKELAQFLPADIRRRMNMNENGTLNPSTMEQEFKMPSSLAQRLVDALPYESIEAKYQLGGKEITLPEGKARQSVGGEAYRRAILQETRMLYEQGKLRPVGIGTMSKDRWGSLGFLAANGKTKASGDFTTVCPQMMFNRGCWYCYRRAAMEKGVNNKLVAQNVWYTGEILRIKDSDVAELNKNGGLRIQSFGDWMPHFSAMLADVLYDAELRGLQVKIITKEPGMINYIAALRDQGIGKNLYFNLSADYTIERGPAKQAKGADSLDAVNPERPYMRDQDNAFWWKRAMSVEEASRYREKYPWVNTRIVATDVEEFIRGLRDSRVDVVTGYHGNIRGIERVDSTTGARKIEVEALGDAGMPRFAFNPVSGQWVVEYEGKTATHKKLAQAIAENGLQMEYYTKTCCITGRCATCYGKCGAIARDFNVKNATNRDGQSIAYWQRQMEYAIEPELGDMTGESADEASKNTVIAQFSEVKYSGRGSVATTSTASTGAGSNAVATINARDVVISDGGVRAVNIDSKKSGLVAHRKGKWASVISEQIRKTLSGKSIIAADGDIITITNRGAREVGYGTDSIGLRDEAKKNSDYSKVERKMFTAEHAASIISLSVYKSWSANTEDPADRFKKDGLSHRSVNLYIDGVPYVATVLTALSADAKDKFNYGDKFYDIVDIKEQTNQSATSGDTIKASIPHTIMFADDSSDKLTIAQKQRVVNRQNATYSSGDAGNSTAIAEAFARAKTLRSDRDTESVSNRALLANALESVVQNDIERSKIQEYRGKIDLINAEERKLQELNRQIRELSFAKGAKDTAKIRELQFEARKTANRINIYDKQILRLEASKPLQDVLAREKKKAYDRAKQKGEEALSAYKLKAEVKQSETLRDYREARAALRQQRSETAVMEKEFIRIAKAYEKLEAKTTAKSGKDAQTIADLKAALKEESRKHKSDQKIWEVEFNRLLREYEASGRSITKLEEKIERQKANAEAKVESRKKTAMRHKIKAFKARLEGSLLRPTDRRYVPIDLVKAMVEVCDLIDMDTELYNADGSINKAQEKRDRTKEKLQDLKDEYEKLKTTSDPIYAGEFDEMVYAYLTELRDNFSGKSLKEMNLDELTEMYETLRSIEETLQDARKLIGWGDAETVYEAGDAIVAEQTKITQSRNGGKRNAVQTARDKSLNLSLSPVRNVERMSGYNQDSYLLKMFKKFERGIRKKNRFVMDAYKGFEALTSGKEHENAMYTEVGGKKYRDVNGRRFGISKMQMMQAVLSYEREKANGLHHIENSGFSFADLDMLRKGNLRDAVSEEYSHRVPAADLVEEFNSALKNDKWCQAYMDAARKFFNGTAKDAINETSIALKHRIIAKDKSYIPFEVDKNFVVREISAENDIQQTINSYGMLMDTKKGASQPLIITGLNNILDRHIDQVGNVYGLAIEVRNFNKVWNVRSLDAAGNDTIVKAIIQRNWGHEGVKHIEQAVQDIQGARVRERSALYDKVKSNYIGATFLLNLSVVTKQVGSLYSATSMLKWRSPARQMGNLLYTMVNHKKISAEVDKYTATAWMRRQGLSDAELHSFMTEGKKTPVGRVVGKLPAVFNPGKWITAMDHAVALSLWKYAKQDTAKRTGLKGEELLKATAEFYDDVIENTQSMNDVLHRPEIQKRDDILSESFAMFKTDLYQMAGQLQVAAGRYAANKNKENGNALVRTVYSIAMSAVWAQLMTTAFAMIRYKVNPYRDEEDKELTYDSWLKRQGFSLAGDLMGYVFPILGSEAVGFFENIMYGESDDIVDSIVLTAINGLYDTMTLVATAIKDGEMPKPDQIKKLVVKALQVFGFPANNILRTIDAIHLHATDIANGEFLSFEAGADRSPKHHIHRIVEAMAEGKTNMAIGLYEEALEETAMGKTEDGSYGEKELKEAKSLLKTALGDKYKDGEISDKQAVDILVKCFGMERDEAEQDVGKWAFKVRYGVAWSDRADAYMSGAISANEFKRILMDVGGKSAEEADEYIAGLDFEMEHGFGYDDREQAYMDGEISAIELKQILMDAGGKTEEEADEYIAGLDFEAEHGFAYSDRKQVYMDGGISAYEMENILMEMGGLSETEAKETVLAYDWMKENSQHDLSVTDAKRFAVRISDKCKDYTLSDYGVSVETYLEYVKGAKDCPGTDTDGDGKIDSYSQAKQLFDMIHKLPISDQQKNALAYITNAESTVRKYAPWR